MDISGQIVVVLPFDSRDQIERLLRDIDTTTNPVGTAAQVMRLLMSWQHVDPDCEAHSPVHNIRCSLKQHPLQVPHEAPGGHVWVQRSYHAAKAGD